MQRQIQEIQYLATKYSKAALGRMVQLGLLDPQKAMMAGMMIQRIEQQNAKPPQTTVAQEVLGLPTVAVGPQSQPSQVGPSPAPTASPPVMTAADGGLLNIPAGDVGEYAGGGIVAFDDGGEVEGYAEGGVARFKDQGYVKSEWQIPPSVQAQRDQERQRILMRELEDARARLARGDTRAQADVDALTRELRRMVPKPSADAGITSLIPSAQATETTPAEKTSSPAGRSLKKIVGTGAEEMGEAYRTGLGVYDKRLSDVNQRIGDLSGFLGTRQQTPAQEAEYNQLTKDRQVLMNARNNLAQDIRKYSGGVAALPAAPSVEAVTPSESDLYGVKQDQFPLQSAFDLGKRRQEGVGYTDARTGQRVGPDGLPVTPSPAREVPPAPAPEVPAVSKIKRPEIGNLSFEDYIARATPKVGTLSMTKEKKLKEIGDERREAERAAGYNPEEVFNKMIDKIEKKKGTAASEKDIAFGQFFVTTGLNLLSARQGQEFEKLSEGAQKGFTNYQEAIKDLKARQEKYDERIETLRLADLQARKTGLDSDIARRDKIAEQVQADRRAVYQAENNAANTAVNAAASLTVAEKNNLMQLYRTDVEENRAREELKLRGKELDLRGRQLDVTANYYTGLLKSQEERNKALGANAQAKYLGAKQKILDGMSSDPRYAAFVKDLKGRYGDNWANIPKAQTEFSNFQRTYLGQKLEAMGELGSDMSGIKSAYDLLAE